MCVCVFLCTFLCICITIISNLVLGFYSFTLHLPVAAASPTTSNIICQGTRTDYEQIK